MNRVIPIFLSLAILPLVSCRGDADSESNRENSAAATAPTPTNRVDIPATVRTNLGITFAKVEVRDVARTIRVPGSFELSPEARREYRTMANGRVDLNVAQ